MTDWAERLLTRPSAPPPPPEGDWAERLLRGPQVAEPQAPPAAARPSMAPARETTAGDMLRGGAQGLFRGLTNLAGLPAEVVNLANRHLFNPLIHGPNAERMSEMQRVPLEPQDLRRGALSVAPDAVATELTGDVGTPGRYARAGSEFVPAAMAGPGGILNRVITGGVSGLLGEGATDLARAGGVPEAYAPIAGAVTGIGAYGLLNRPQLARANPPQIIREATADIRPQEWQAATQRAEAADYARLRLPPGQALGPAGSAVQGLTSDVAATRYGAPIQRAIREQPGQVQERSGEMIEALAGPRGEPAQTAREVSDSARGVIQEARRFRTQQASPFYQAAAREPVQPGTINASLNQAIAQFDPGSPTAATIRTYQGRINQAQNNAQLDSIYRDLRSEIETLRRANPGDSTAANLSRVRTTLDQTIRALSPNIQQGRMRHQIASERVDELRSPELLGNMQGELMEGRRIAPTLNRQIEAIAGENASPTNIRRIFDELSMSRNPEAGRALAGEYLNRTLTNAATPSGANPDPSSIAGLFRNALVGNPDRSGRTEAVMRGLATANGLSGGSVWAGFSRFMDVLNQMGRIPPVGSRTGPREMLSRSLGDNWISRGLDTANVMQGSALRAGSTRLREITGAADYRDLARVLSGTNPENLTQTLSNVEGLRLLQEMAGQFSNTPRVRLLATRLLEIGNANAAPVGAP